MGSNFANEMADGTLADLGIHVTLRQAIGWHLQGNHFPPVPSSMIDPCIEAIDACNDEDTNRLIALPEGITWRNQESAPAWAIVEGHHLDAWIGYYAFDEEYGNCDTCGNEYELYSRDGRCGDCGECSAHCTHGEEI